MIERLLIVGRGSIGQRHLRLARGLLPKARIGVLGRPRSLQDGEPVADHYFTGMEQALAFTPQVAVIANPASMHVGTALPLAHAGVHLLIEKPIGHSAQGLRELLDTAKARKIVLMTGYNLRFLPSLRKFRELLNDSLIGRALSVRAEVGQYLPSWRPNQNYRESVSAQAALGGGALLELSHEIDYLRWLFGDIAWVNAVACTQSNLVTDVEDAAHLVLGFVGQEKPIIASLNLDFIRHDMVRQCAVIGEAGTLKWDALTGAVSIFRAGASAWETMFSQPPQKDATYIAEWEHFLDCIATGSVPLVGGEDGLAVVQAVESAKLSSRNGAVVRLAPAVA